MTCNAAQPQNAEDFDDLTCTLDEEHVGDHEVTDGEGGKWLASWPNEDRRTITDADAMDKLLAQWRADDHGDGWNGADAVDFIGYLLIATGRLAMEDA